MLFHWVRRGACRHEASVGTKGQVLHLKQVLHSRRVRRRRIAGEVTVVEEKAYNRCPAHLLGLGLGFWLGLGLGLAVVEGKA